MCVGGVVFVCTCVCTLGVGRQYGLPFTGSEWKWPNNANRMAEMLKHVYIDQGSARDEQQEN